MVSSVKRCYSGDQMNQRLKTSKEPGVVAHAYKPNIWKTEAGGLLSLRPAGAAVRLPRTISQQQHKRILMN